MAGIAIAAGLALALAQGQWDTGFRAEGRASRHVAAELQLDPFARAASTSPDLVLRAGFSPQLVLRDAPGSDRLDVLYRAELAARWRLDPDATLAATQDGSVGSRSLSWLALAPDEPPPVDVQRIGGPAVDLVSERSTVAFVERISNQLLFGARAAFGIGGALHDRDLAAFPRTSAAELGATARWVERDEALSLALDGSHGWISGGRGTDALSLWAGWRHAFTAASRRALREGLSTTGGGQAGLRFETELRAGAAVIGGDGQPTRATPAAALSFLREAPPARGAIATRLTFRYAPAIDPTTGAFAPRGEASTDVDVRLERRLLATLAGGAGYTPDAAPPYPRFAAQGELGLTYEAAAGVAISAATRVARFRDGAEWAAIVRTTIAQHGRF
jgi:hypothetical protein